MPQSASSLNIRNAIKGLLKKHGHSYKDLSKALELSEGAIKQLMTKGSFTTDRVEKVAHWFGLSLLEFMEVALNKESKPHKLTLEQEEILLSFPISIWMLFLLGSGYSLESTKERMNLEEKKFQKALHTLDRTGLIELLPLNKIRLKSRAPYRFNTSGGIENKLRKDYLDLVARQVQFNPLPDTYQRTFEMYFSTELLKSFKEEQSKLLAKYAQLARIETEQDHSDKTFPVTGLFLLKPFDGWGTLLKSKK